MSSPSDWLSREFSKDNPLIVGMLHVPALPASPRYNHDLDRVLDHVLQDAEAWVTAGVNHLMLENFGDVPFYPKTVPPITVAHLTAIAWQVKARFPVSLGINILRNDGVSALAIAHAIGGSAIRVNVLSSSRVTDQGIIEGNASELLRQRKQLNAESISILADVDVKHSAPLAARSLTDQTHDLIDRALADAVIVSGPATGQSVNQEVLAEVSSAAGDTPILIGSGVSTASAASLKSYASGYIIGTSAKQDNNVQAPVDTNRAAEICVSLR